MTDFHEKSLDHAWRYFELHANQRMTVFNFFLVATGLISAGIAASLQSDKNLTLLGVFLGILLAFISFIFWKLDQRVCSLMKSAELAMASLESVFPIDTVHLFKGESALTNEACSTGNSWIRHWTYGQSFRVTFWTTGIFGASSALFSIFSLLGLLQ
ncbi:hypothetical protein [Pseudomonas sp.]|uniref:hypothetical protein n=1 Tax=Pseudomonas sp. TaxID=306 RepID=UPI003BB4D30D